MTVDEVKEKMRHGPRYKVAWECDNASPGGPIPQAATGTLKGIAYGGRYLSMTLDNGAFLDYLPVSDVTSIDEL